MFVLALRVLVLESDPGLFAEAIEVPYGCAGETREDAATAFNYGLAATLEVNFNTYGSLKNFFREHRTYGLTMHRLLRAGELHVFKAEPFYFDGFPYTAIQYLSTSI